MRSLHGSSTQSGKFGGYTLGYTDPAMGLQQWLQPPRRSLSIFLFLTLALTAAFGWLSHGLLERDRDLQRQRTDDRLERTLDVVTASLRERFAEADALLAGAVRSPVELTGSNTLKQPLSLGHDSAIVVMSRDTVSVLPPARLAYYPIVPDDGTFDESALAEAERLEFRDGDMHRAAAAYTAIARNADRRVRAHALIRLAAVQRKLKAGAAALAVYQDLSSISGVTIDGKPLEVLSRHARCATLQELGERQRLIEEARALWSDLSSARWTLSAGAYAFYVDEVRRWLPSVAQEDEVGRAQRELADVVTMLWNEWQASRAQSGGLAARRTVWIEDTPWFVAATREADRIAALVAGPQTFEATLFPALADAATEHGVDITIMDGDGRVVYGRHPPDGPDRAIRTAAEARLPWTIAAVPAARWGEDAALAERRRLTVLGAVLVIGCVLAGGYFTARAMHRELEVARLKSEFVAAVSHDFRTPLASFRQLSELLLDGRVAGDAQRVEYYRRLYGESGRLQRLVENLLDFGRIEAGAREFTFRPGDPADLVRRVATEFGDECTAGRQIHVDVRAPLPPIQMDQDAIGRAMWNLLDNAVKYSSAPDSVEVSATSRQSCVAIAIRDKGIGIPAARQRDIFQKFVRVADSTQSAAPGTGLGLAMVSHIIDAHGGRIEVESAPGAGSTFTILLPCTRPS